MQIDAQFTGDAEKSDIPQTVFITFSKEGMIPYTVQADYLKAIQRYQVGTDLRFLMKEKVNGDYKLTAHI
jgi:hypothetical protein